MASIGELFVELGFDIDTKTLDDFNERIKDAQNNILKMSAVATAGAYALNAFMEGPAHRALFLREFTQETGYSADALQKWALAISIASKGAVGFDQAMQNYGSFAKNIGLIGTGQGPSGAFAMLGGQWNPHLTPEQAAEQIASHIRQTIANYGRTKTSELLGEVGLGEGAINALLLSDGERDDMTRGRMMTQEQQEGLLKYQEMINQITADWRQFQAEVGAQWGPELAANIKDIEQTMEHWIPVILEVVKDLGGWKKIMEAILVISFARWALAVVADMALVTIAFGRVAAAAGAAAVAGGNLAGAGVVAAAGALPSAAAAGVGAVALGTGFGAVYEADKHIPFIHRLFQGYADDQVQNNGMMARIIRYFHPELGAYSPSGINAAALMRQPGSSSFAGVTNHNTFYIQSSADARDVADEAVQALDQQNNNSYQQLDLGPNH